MEIFIIVLVVAGIVYAFAKRKKSPTLSQMSDEHTGKMPEGQFREQLEKLRMANGYYLDNFYFGMAINSSVRNYSDHFVPNKSLLEGVVLGQIAGGAIGNAHSLQSFLGNYKSLKQGAIVRNRAGIS